MMLRAKFESTTFCPAGCGNRIHRGDPIRYDQARGAFVHDECAPAEERPPATVRCTICGREKPCRCDD